MLRKFRAEPNYRTLVIFISQSLNFIHKRLAGVKKSTFWFAVWVLQTRHPCFACCWGGLDINPAVRAMGLRKRCAGRFISRAQIADSCRRTLAVWLITAIV